MKMKTALLRFFLGAAWLASIAAAPVKTEGGLVEGTVADGLTIYRGIPFAAPPVGDLRWRPPQPAGKWSGTLQADKFAASCMQGGGAPNAKAKAPAPQGPGTSEDCLYLNVWTPAKAASDRLPVLVWIYGGGFTGGATSVPVNSGEQLAKKGVVFVSIAYRVGPFGFMAHPVLTAESKNHASGNYGMLDMIAGLQWVQKNIAAFGGNPGKVTIMGESAGGIAVSQLCASPLAKGLFHGAISESGGSFGPSRPVGLPGENMVLLADAERAGEAYAKTAGAASIEDLRKLPAAKVLETTRGQAGLGWPIVDGWVIPDDQYRLYEAKRYNETPKVGSVVGYASLMSIAQGLKAAGAVDTEKLVDAFAGLKVDTPYGQIHYRKIDHQSTMGVYVGVTAVEDGKGIMKDFAYIDGARLQPPDEQVRKMRPAN